MSLYENILLYIIPIINLITLILLTIEEISLRKSGYFKSIYSTTTVIMAGGIVINTIAIILSSVIAIINNFYILALILVLACFLPFIIGCFLDKKYAKKYYYVQVVCLMICFVMNLLLVLQINYSINLIR